MKKILNNKKGFTLVELLAVIVVLAIIMVIATQRIGNVIKQNTVSSFKSSLEMVAKSAKQADMLADGALTLDKITNLVDYDPAQFTISLETNNVCIQSINSGKFHKMDCTMINALTGVATKSCNASGVSKICKTFR